MTPEAIQSDQDVMFFYLLIALGRARAADGEVRRAAGTAGLSSAPCPVGAGLGPVAAGASNGLKGG